MDGLRRGLGIGVVRAVMVVVQRRTGGHGRSRLGSYRDGFCLPAVGSELLKRTRKIARRRQRRNYQESHRQEKPQYGPHAHCEIVSLSRASFDSISIGASMLLPRAYGYLNS